MPRWWVHEPYENLWMSDTPLSYTMSSGQEMAFTFYYRQRYKLPEPDEVPNLYPPVTCATPAGCRIDGRWSYVQNYFLNPELLT